MRTVASEQQVWDALREVDDPEIPGLSVVDLGIIRAVRSDERGIEVEVMPTFTGCPALTVMREEIAERVRALGAEEVEVPISFNPPWTSDRISESARLKMRTIGLEPPIKHGGRLELALEGRVHCPYCGSDQTDLENPFGPTLCRALHYCRSCQQPFEQFKAL